MPLDATLVRIQNNRFNLTVPPVRFFTLSVSPMLYCDVRQTNSTVEITSTECILRGSQYVTGLNNCFKFSVKTVFTWTDTPIRKAIQSKSIINVLVDPPPPFKYFGKSVLENTGTLAMRIALRQIENAFVQSLAKDYQHWATDKDYRMTRANVVRANSKKVEIKSLGSLTLSAPSIESEVEKEDISTSIDPSAREENDIEKAQNTEPLRSEVNAEKSSLSSKAPSKDAKFKETDASSSYTLSAKEMDSIAEALPLPTDDGVPAALTDQICLLPGEEPLVRIEEAPQNARRIFSGVDIVCNVDTVWKILTNYEKLQDVVPSLVKNEIVYRTDDGGARLKQVGGAKVLPGVTFTAKTVLDIAVYTEENPISDDLLACNPPSNKTSEEVRLYYKGMPLQRGRFPRPYAITSLPHRDITMQNVEDVGDFEHYQGVWRMQSLPNCSINGNDVTRLTYAVEIRPKGFLPVGLIEGRIASDLKTNLEAIRRYAEKLENTTSTKNLMPNNTKITAIPASQANVSIIQPQNTAFNISMENSAASRSVISLESTPSKVKPTEQDGTEYETSIRRRILSDVTGFLRYIFGADILESYDDNAIAGMVNNGGSLDLSGNHSSSGVMALFNNSSVTLSEDLITLKSENARLASKIDSLERELEQVKEAVKALAKS